jgi:hypothetical protein
MVAMLLRIVGIDLKRVARETAVTIVLVMLGVFAAMLTLALGFVAFYLCIESRLGTFPALGILGGTSALLAVLLIAIAFKRRPHKQRAHVYDDLRAAADPVQASAATLARAADEAVNGAADMVRNGSRQQIVGTVAVVALMGWLLGRRSRPGS